MLNENQYQEKIVKPLKNENLNAPDQLWFRIQNTLNQPDSVKKNFFLNSWGLKLAPMAMVVILMMGVGLFQMKQPSVSDQVNTYLNEAFIQNDSFFENVYVELGTF